MFCDLVFAGSSLLGWVVLVAWGVVALGRSGSVRTLIFVATGCIVHGSISMPLGFCPLGAVCICGITWASLLGLLIFAFQVWDPGGISTYIVLLHWWRTYNV